MSHSAPAEETFDAKRSKIETPTFRRRFARAIDLGDLSNVSNLGRNAAVNAEQLPLNERRDRQTIERFHAFVVEKIAQFQQTFVFESTWKRAVRSLMRRFRSPT